MQIQSLRHNKLFQQRNRHFMKIYNFVCIISSFCCLIACCKTQNENEIENKFTPEDFKLKIEALNHRDYIIQKFNDTIPNSKYDYYYLIYFNAFNEGNSIKFINKEGRYYLTEKIRYPKKGFPTLTEYSTEISEKEWDRLDKMLNEFDFWTEKQFKHNSALDGFHFYLEVNKSTDKEKNHRIVGRATPRYDKIGALCEYIIRFKETIVLSNTLMNE